METLWCGQTCTCVCVQQRQRGFIFNTKCLVFVHVPKRGFGPSVNQDQTRGYGPPTPPSENSDGEVPAHLRSKDDDIRMIEERLIQNAIEISRRDEIIAKNQAVERNLEEARANRRNARSEDRAAAAPVMIDALSQPSPPQPPPPKQQPDTLKRDMEQAMAAARAKNAAEDTGWASNFVEAAVRAKHAIGSVLSTEGPVPVMKPPPTSTPKTPFKPFFSSPHRSDDDEAPEHWESSTAIAAKQAAEVIAKAKEKAFPSQPRSKPPPKGFEYINTTGKVPSSCPVLRAILDRNGEGPLPPPATCNTSRRTNSKYFARPSGQAPSTQ
eukprot:3394251-Amphidinium_carterae.1